MGRGRLRVSVRGRLRVSARGRGRGRGRVSVVLRAERCWCCSTLWQPATCGLGLGFAAGWG